jgi:DNA-binding PadR family transcriptional regulator
MQARDETSKAAQKSAPVLRGPLLGLLVNQEQPNHIYKLMGLLAQRLPAWQASRQDVRYALKLLEEEGYARSIVGTGTSRKVYIPTENTRFALDEWMEQAVSSQPVREELHARIVSSCPHHAPLLLKALDVFEQQCYARLDETLGAEANAGSWRSLTINIGRAADDEDTHAKIKWAKTARKWLKDYAGQRGDCD